MLKQLKQTLATPAYKLLWRTSLDNAPLLIFNIITNLLGIFFEGSTLGVIYLAIATLSNGTENIQKIPFLDRVFTQFTSIDNPQVFFLVLLGVAIVLQTLLALSKYGNKVSAAILAARLQPQITGKIFQQILSFSFGCASRYKVGDLMSYASSSGGTINRQIMTLNDLIISFSFTLVYAFVLVSLSKLLALIAVILALTLILFQRLLLPKIHTAARNLVQAQVAVSKRMTETIQSLRLVHTFGTQTKEIESIQNALQDTETALVQRAFLINLTEPILDILPVLALALLAMIAFLTNAENETILPLLLTFLVALQRLATRLRGVSNSITQIIDQGAQMQRINEILRTEDKEFLFIAKNQFEHLETDIQLDNISLSYGKDGDYALKDVNLTIPHHKVTALVGGSGAGKSSLIDLVVGLYQPTQGDIRVNNQSIYEYNQSSWRHRIGVVSQDTIIFNTSIRNNLIYGAGDVSFDEIIEITKAAQAHDFILELPNGYDTLVGERGYRLSGGQRQRLALARALIKNPDILILDEATSALDSQSERLIQEALERFQQGRTVLVIAHRLSTIVGADQIVVLDHGEIIEVGNHQSLIQKKGHYAKAWQLQTDVSQRILRQSLDPEKYKPKIQ